MLREDKQALFSQAQLETLGKLHFSNDITAALDYKVCTERQILDAVTRQWLNK